MNQHSKQLQEKLWAAAEQLRANGSLKLNEISEPVLGLIFLKFADVRFKKAQSIIAGERQKTSGGRQRPITADDYKSRGVLYIPEHATYSHLMSLAEGKNIGKAINEAMKAIEEHNRELAGILPQDYTDISKKPDENSRILITLLKNFNQIPDDIEGDTFGEIYEYFLGEFARAEGAKGGEFFTPQSIVKLLVEILEPYHGKIYDPACGSGGMFVQSARFVAEHMKTKRPIMEEVGIFGQEKGEGNLRIAKMNLAIHGISGKIELANSYYEDPHHSIGKFDFVLANPPFNVKGKDKNKQLIIDPARLHNDKRYAFGLPLTGKGEITNGNYLWIQIFASALSKDGRSGFVMHDSASDVGNAQKTIRKKIINACLVDVMILVGPNMFLNAAQSCTLWFFDKRKIDTSRQNKVLFIDAKDIFTEIDRAHSIWTDKQIQEISEIVRSYREEEGAEPYKDIKGRCKVATIEDMSLKGYSLNPGRYIEVAEKRVNNIDLESRMKELIGQFTSLTSQSHELEKKIIEEWGKIL